MVYFENRIDRKCVTDIKFKFSYTDNIHEASFGDFLAMSGIFGPGEDDNYEYVHCNGVVHYEFDSYNKNFNMYKHAPGCTMKAIYDKRMKKYLKIDIDIEYGDNNPKNFENYIGTNSYSTTTVLNLLKNLDASCGCENLIPYSK